MELTRPSLFLLLFELSKFVVASLSWLICSHFPVSHYIGIVIYTAFVLARNGQPCLSKALQIF